MRGKGTWEGRGNIKEGEEKRKRDMKKANNIEGRREYAIRRGQRG